MNGSIGHHFPKSKAMYQLDTKNWHLTHANKRTVAISKKFFKPLLSLSKYTQDFK